MAQEVAARILRNLERRTEDPLTLEQLRQISGEDPLKSSRLPDVNLGRRGDYRPGGRWGVSSGLPITGMGIQDPFRAFYPILSLSGQPSPQVALGTRDEDVDFLTKIFSRGGGSQLPQGPFGSLQRASDRLFQTGPTGALGGGARISQDPKDSLRRKGYIVPEPGGNRTVSVSTIGPPPTPEEITQIMEAAFGEGAARKEHLTDLGGAVGSMVGAEASKRAFLRSAGTGLRVAGLGLKRIVGPVVGAAIGAFTGEAARLRQTDPDVGRFTMVDVGDRALMGTTDVHWDPRSPSSRFKMMGLRAAESAGLDVLGAGVVQGAALAGKGMYRMGFTGANSPIADILARTKRARGFLNRLGLSRGRRGSTGIEDIMRLGDEGRFGAAGWTNPILPGRVPPGLGEAPPGLRARGGRYPLGRIGTQATEAGWGQYGDLPRAMRASAEDAKNIVQPLWESPVAGMEKFSISEAVLNTPGPKGVPLHRWLGFDPDSGVTPVLIRGDAGLKSFPKRIQELLKRYVADKPKESDFMPLTVSVRDVMDDLTLIDGELSQLYDLIKAGQVTSAGDGILVLKALRQVLSDRVGTTIEKLDAGIHTAWKQQRELSQTMGDAMDMVKGSADTILTGLALGATALGGTAAGAGVPGVIGGVAGAAPALVLGGSPPVSAMVGQALYNVRGSTLPQQLVRATQAGVPQEGIREIFGSRQVPEPSAAMGAVEAAGGRMLMTGDPMIPMQPMMPGGQPLTLDQAQVLALLMAPR